MPDRKMNRLMTWQAQGLNPDNCPVRFILAQVASKWPVLILIELHEGPRRFNVLLRVLPDISRRMLTQSLRELERDGIVDRRVLDTRPPGVEYALTQVGRSLMLPLLGLVDWASGHGEVILSARKKFAAASLQP